MQDSVKCLSLVFLAFLANWEFLGIAIQSLQFLLVYAVFDFSSCDVYGLRFSTKTNVFLIARPENLHSAKCAKMNVLCEYSEAFFVGDFLQRKICIFVDGFFQIRKDYISMSCFFNQIKKDYISMSCFLQSNKEKLHIYELFPADK
jgi:hypothetical protein